MSRASFCKVCDSPVFWSTEDKEKMPIHKKARCGKCKGTHTHWINRGGKNVCPGKQEPSMPNYGKRAVACTCTGRTTVRETRRCNACGHLKHSAVCGEGGK